MKIWGDVRSGNCLKVKFVCDYLAIPYEWIDVDVTSGDTKSQDFLAINPAGQLPAIQLADGRCLAQSNAIISFLARDSDLIPETAFEQALMNQWLFWEQNFHEPSIATRRFLKAFCKKADGEIAPEMLDKGNAALDHMENHLSRHDYFVGKKMSLADIALFAYTRWAEEGGFALSDRPNVSAWISRLSIELSIS